jgi:hypothetical protein
MSSPPKQHQPRISPFVPADFVVPAYLETDRFRLRMLTIHDLELDFAAVTSSTEHLQTIWNNDWPLGLTLEQNLIDLGWHQKEFQRRRSFAYTVVSLDESRVLGCVYIYPPSRQGFDAEVYLWARADELPGGLEKELEVRVRNWLAERWPFQNVAYPGRSISWPDWEAMD